MLEGLKRWISGHPDEPQSRVLSQWARDRGHVFKTVRDERGGVVECRNESPGGVRQWRLEWGRPQRRYIQGLELRLREELGLSGDVQILLIARSLADKMEHDVFERYTEAMQTHVDTSMPEEMRWLAMFPKLTLPGHKPLRSHLQLLCPIPGAAEAWISGELGHALEAAYAIGGVLHGDPPFLMQVLRGRLYLRLSAPELTPALLDGVNSLFALAASRARADLASVAQPPEPHTSGWHSSAPTAWQSLSGLHPSADAPPVPGPGGKGR